MIKALARRALERFTRVDPAWFTHEPVDAVHDIELTYLGTAGFVVRGRGRTLVLDPYVTRIGLPDLFTQPLTPSQLLLRANIPSADDVLVGHAHYDHVLDAPALCRQTGARLIGSRAVCMVGRAAGLSESLSRETAGREDIASGAFTVRGLPSLHGKALFGRIPLPGDITEPPRWPPRIFDLRHGLVLNWLLQTEGFSLVHVDSADFVREELANVRADVVCLCAIGRKYRPHYVAEIVALLKPKYVVPCHWDTMITPLRGEPQALPFVDLPGMLAEVRAAGATPLAMPLLGKLRF